MKDPQSKHALVSNCMLVLQCLYANLSFLFRPTEYKHVRRQHAHSVWIMDLHILFFSGAWGSNKKLRSTVFHSTSTEHSQNSKLVITHQHADDDACDIFYELPARFTSGQCPSFLGDCCLPCCIRENRVCKPASPPSDLQMVSEGNKKRCHLAAEHSKA